jgi:hypothetical protein
MENKFIEKCINASLLLGWVSIWFSISFNPNLLLTINLKNFNEINTIEYLRGFSQILLFIYLLFLIILFIFKKKLNFKNQLVNLLFISIFILQIIGLVLTKNSPINFYYNICSINVVLICLIASAQLEKKILSKIFYISIIFLISIFFFYAKDYFLLTIKSSLNFYSVWGSLDSLSENITPPRPTGLSRTALILIIFFSVYNLDQGIFKNYIKIILSILSFFILVLSSRATIFCLILYLIFFNYYFNKNNIKKILENIIIYIFVPFIFIQLLSFNFQSSQLFNKNKIANELEVNEPEKKKIIRNYNKLKDFSSGRFNDWKKIIKMNENIIFGNGTMGDRYLINQTASNIFLYIYASNGIVGLVLLLYCKLLIIKQCFYFFYVNRQEHKHNYIKLINSLLLIFVLMRSMIETSYGIFGIDFILFCLASNIIYLNFKR